MLPTAAGSRTPPGSPSAAAAAKAGVVLPSTRCMWRMLSAALCAVLFVAFYGGRWTSQPPPTHTERNTEAPTHPAPPCPEPAHSGAPVGGAETTSQPSTQTHTDTDTDTDTDRQQPAARRPTSLLVEPPPVRCTRCLPSLTHVHIQTLPVLVDLQVRWPEPIIPKIIHQTWKGESTALPSLPLIFS